MVYIHDRIQSTGGENLRLKLNQKSLMKRALYKKIICIIAIVSLLCLFIAPVIYIPSINSNSSQIVLQNKKTIPLQDIIDRAKEGDRIEISEGEYNENLIINKTLNLIGKNKSLCKINGITSTSPAITITAPNCSLMNLSIVRSPLKTRNMIEPSGGNTGYFNPSNQNGILLESNFNKIENCNISCGIDLQDSLNNTITNNLLTYSYYGIAISSSNNNQIMYNTIRYTTCGLSLLNSNNNIISNNIFSLNKVGLNVNEDCQKNIIEKNTFQNNDAYDIHIYYKVRYKNDLKDNSGKITEWGKEETPEFDPFSPLVRTGTVCFVCVGIPCCVILLISFIIYRIIKKIRNR